ncbi:ATP-grasp domain-containing protein [Alteromonas sp. S015]|uniref:ATP-grasp domain-containing protein n=1 Tax=Alteromonas sp. S015 TaxID=3117401 RepID=UPI002FE068C5
MHHVILGHQKDLHATYMLDAMRKKGLNAHLLQSSDFPRCIQLAYSPTDDFGHLLLSDGNKLAFNEITSVYWRNFCGVSDEAHRENFGTAEYISARDSMACLRSWFNVSGNTLWANSWQAYEHHKEKPWQLLKAKRQGLNVPRTLVTNDLDEILNWYTTLEKSIFKPVTGGSHTEILCAEHFESARITDALTKSPITVQEYIEGTNIRTFVIGDHVFSAELRSDCVDFREDKNMGVIPIETPKDVVLQAISVMKALHMNWTAIDWRRDKHGVYYFLEANPSPMFYGFEAQTGIPITDHLISLLAKGKSGFSQEKNMHLVTA